MEAELEQLAQKIVEQYKSTPSDRRLLVAIAGPPGSGKSTLAYPLTDRINTLLLHRPAPHPAVVDPDTGLAQHWEDAGSEDEVAICVGLDGWHYSLSQLDKLDDPVKAHWLRGAAYTFDLPAYYTFLSLLRLPLEPNPPLAIPFPTFDHAIKNPAPSPTPISPRHRIVLIEGLHTLLSKPGWRECAKMMDRRVWVECDRAAARERLVQRNFAAGIVDDLAKCAERVDAVDMKTGDEVRANRVEPTDVVTSADDLIKSPQE